MAERSKVFSPRGMAWKIDSMFTLSAFRCTLKKYGPEQIVFGFHQKILGKEITIHLPEKSARRIIAFMITTLRNMDQLPLNEMLMDSTSVDQAETRVHRLTDPLTQETSVSPGELEEQMLNPGETYTKYTRTALIAASKHLKRLAAHIDKKPYKGRQSNLEISEPSSPSASPPRRRARLKVKRKSTRPSK